MERAGLRTCDPDWEGPEHKDNFRNERGLKPTSLTKPAPFVSREVAFG